jgi:hypothetical protein
MTYRRILPGKPRRTCVLYRAWMNLWQRVRGVNHDGRGNYRWAGLPVADEWKSYDSFREWALRSGFSSVNRSLDRINENAGYEPANCQWVTKAENCRKAMRVRYG